MRRSTLVLAAFATLSLAPTARAQPDSALLGAHPAMFWAISVANLDRQLAFYRDTLGFSVYSQGDVAARGIRFALLKQGDALIELVQLPTSRPRADAADPAQTHGFFKGGVVVADVAALERRLRERGVKLAFELGKPQGGPYRVFGVRDPEGNLLQFFGP